MPSKEILADLKVAALLKDLVNTDGWKEYERLLELKIKEKTSQALMPVMPNTEVDGISQVLFGEASKGAIMGLRLALMLPSAIVEQAKQHQDKPSSAGEKK